LQASVVVVASLFPRLPGLSRLRGGAGGAGGQYVVIGAVIASTFFIGFGGGVIFPILPNLGAVLGISPLLVGVILSANRFSRLVANAPAGVLVDRVGTRTPMVAGMVVQGVATAGYVIAMLAPFPEGWFIVARILWGVGSAAVFATAFTIAADVSDGGSRGANMGLIRGGVLFGFPTGLVLGGVVSELGGTIAAFGTATVFAFVASAVAFLLIPETHVEGDHHRSVKPWDVDTTIPALTVGTVNFAVFFVYVGALFSTLVLVLPERGISAFGLGPQGSSGVFMAITVVVAAGFMFLGGYVSDRRGSRVPTLLVFLLVTAAGFLLLARARSPEALVASCVCIGAGQGGTSGPLMALLADLTPDERMGRAVGTNNVFGDVGGGLGPIVSLPIVDAVGFSPVYLACAALPLLATGVLLAGVRRETGQWLPSVEF
jgi:MFS family permease